MAAILLQDGLRARFAASVGLAFEPVETTQLLTTRVSGMLWIEDACKDARSPPWIPVEAGVRFYARVPLIAVGRVVGSLAVMSHGPKSYDAQIASALEALGRVLSARLQARQDEQMAAGLLSSAADAIICVDDAGKITFWNPAAEQMFGYTASQMLGGPMDILVPERRRDAYKAVFEYARRTGTSQLPRQSIEVPALRKDGSEFPIDVAIAVWGDAGRFGGGLIIRDCSERKAAERALASAKGAAEAANVAKSAFLANISHEIRTPLNGVIGVTELLAASGLSTSQAEMAELIRSSGEQLHGLLGDILDIARIEAGEFSLSTEVLALAPLLTSTVELCGLKAREKGLSLNLVFEDKDNTRVVADPIRLKQILSNLISNAIKFTEKGSVTLAVCQTESSQFQFQVKDTGVGFDPAIKDAIFGRFQQADGSITRKFGGTGLGLAICRQLTDLMGGQISCNSSPGVGSTFTVTLPLEVSGASAVARSYTVEDVCDLPQQRLSILLADDHPTNRRVVELILASLEADITSVEDGAQAVQMFIGRSFDLVLMDMMMPIMDGMAATRAIREHEQRNGLARTPVLMLTANALPEHIDAAIAAGADRHVAKPVTAHRLIEALAKALDGDDASVRLEKQA